MRQPAHLRRAALAVAALALGITASAAALPAAAETASAPPIQAAPVDPSTPPAEQKPAEPVEAAAPNSIVVPATETVTPGEKKQTEFTATGTGTLVFDAPTGSMLYLDASTGCVLNASATRAVCGTDNSRWNGVTQIWVTGLAGSVYGQHADGTMSLTVGGTVTESSPWSVNLIPNAPATNVAASWDQAAPGYAVTGTADPGATVTVEGASGNVIATGTAAGDGAFRVPVSTAPNTLLVTFQAKDGVSSGDYGLARTGALPAPVTQTPSGRVPGASAITGLGFPGATLVVTDTTTGDSLGSTTVKSDGTWNFTIAADLAPGDHILSSAQTFGTTTTTAAPLTTTVIAAPDAPSITSPAAGTNVATGTSTITITGTATTGNDISVHGATGGIACTTHAIADGSFRCDVTGLTDGTNSWRVTQTDEFGRVSSASTASVIRTAPVIPVIDLIGPSAAKTTSDAATASATPEVLAYTGSDGARIAEAIVASFAALTAGLLLMLTRRRATRGR
jgi:hypothetical protein